MNKHETFRERLERCQSVNEGTEIGDIIEGFCSVAYNAKGLGYEHEAELALLGAESMIRGHIKWLHEECPQYEQYIKFCDDETFKYFMDCKRYTKEEFESQITKE